MRKVVLISLLTLTLASCGCKNKGPDTGGGGGGGGSGDAAACDAQLEHMAELYAAARPNQADSQEESAEAAALRAQVARDSAEVVVWDCKKAPARVVPCLTAATTVAEVETRCMQPLDDEGKTEADYFGRPAQ